MAPMRAGKPSLSASQRSCIGPCSTVADWQLPAAALFLEFSVDVPRFYGDELREMFGYEQHPYAFYALAILAVILVGLLYGFFIAIICGQRITERHYHVLAKQELTKEYIVEDLEGSDPVPDLDLSHVTELRTLGLY
ncbi:hypothetical protein ZWY2020_016367 [Hordeum vulgare]|nr:hypothetical protein ZWY2020_016367 [Hordeum vulgare]